MKKLKTKKNGQALVEFVLIGLLVGVVSFWALLRLNPNFFRSYFKGSLSSSTQIDSNGQLTLNDYDETCNASPPPPPPPPPAGCVAMAIGGVESDGTIYAGSSGGHDICTTTADTGTDEWNNGSSSSTANYTFSPTLSIADGQANTAQLMSTSCAASPFEAAAICDGLVANGSSDWYLPSKDELVVVYSNRIAIGGFSTVKYWSSTSTNCHQAQVIDFSSGSITDEDRWHSVKFRCVRHD